jgi:hypothetical protein
VWFLLSFAIGLVLAAIGWLLPRRVARAEFRFDGALALDLIGPFCCWAFLFAASARPIFAGIGTLSLFAGFAFADVIKRQTLREPVVFSDMSEFIELFRHPQLYLPFAGPGLVLGGVAIIALALIALIWLEPGRFAWSPVPGLAVLAIIVAATLALATQPLLGRFAAWARRQHPAGDPFADAARFGPLAMLVIHGAIARAERSGRRAAIVAPIPARTNTAERRPIVVLQCESFFDARRLHPDMPADLLPGFERCRSTGFAAGRFGVTGWGAYTVRSEFAALTGIADTALGFDRWNPYHAFARMPIPSLASRLRDEGYRTVCLHPFDRTYYARHKVLPRLGFDAFLGEEAFAGAARIGPFIADAEIARRAEALLREEGPPLFLFAITMECHGPWLRDEAGRDGADPALALPPIAGGEELRRYLNGLRHTDAMIESLRRMLVDGPGGILALYGDHLPSLPDAFEALDFTGTDTDYAIWDSRGGDGARRDLKAHEFPAALLAAREGPGFAPAAPNG